MIFGAVEAGGTKFVCGVGTAAGGSLEKARLPTEDPASTLAAAVAFFHDAAARHGPIAGLGIASFGPVELDPTAAAYGHITTTPKPGWQDADILGILSRGVGVPAAIDTDVNAAALAEAALGAANGADPVAYVTVGTGIGVGLLVNGQTIHAAGHPELGHIALRRHPAHAHFAGVCPFHGDCLEGLASGPAIAAAWGASLDKLPDDHVAWDVEADTIGQLCAVLILTLSPRKIILGGGVMSQARLLPMIQARTAHWLGGYLPAAATPAALQARIVPPGCTEPPGLVGAYLLAERAHGSAG